MKPYKILQLGEDIWANGLLQSLAKLGCSIQVLSSQNLHLEEIKNYILEFKPDFTLGRNYYFFSSSKTGLDLAAGQELVDFLQKQNIIHLAWQLDDPQASGSTDLLNAWSGGFAPKNTIFLVTDQSHLEFYQKRSLPCYHLPMAAPDHYFDISFATNTKPIPLSFVGSPPSFGDFKQAPQNMDETASFFAIRETMDFKRTLELNNQSLSETDQIKLFETFNNFFKSWPKTSPDYEALTQNLLTQIQQLTNMAGSGSGFLDLRFSYCQLIRSLLSLRDKKIRIFGGASWKQWLGNYQPEYPRLDFYTEVPQLFHESQITFCLTKWQYRTAVHDRPLSVLACGGFPLTDYREDLNSSFEQGEIISYTSIEQASDLIDYYLTHESQRLAVIQKGRERVRQNHTYTHRAQKLLEILGKVK